MCTVLAWQGQLPPNSLSNLLVAAQCRGTDGTGLAWRETKSGPVNYDKCSIPASEYVVCRAKMVTAANASLSGIGHCRNASRNMPVDSNNSHPFIWKNIVYAHNGAVKNWRQLRSTLFAKAMQDSITTDSMTLGPLLEFRDLSQAVGSFGLVWMAHKSVWVTHSEKELETVQLKWEDKKDGSSGNVLIACSTLAIIEKAFDLLDIEYSYSRYDLEEGILYELGVDGDLLSHGDIPINSSNEADAHSSKTNEKALLQLELDNSQIGEGYV